MAQSMTKNSKEDSTKGDLGSSFHSSFLIPQGVQQPGNRRDIVNFLKMIRTYEEGLAFLHYCRLIHKTTQANPSNILSQWLLNICSWLPKMKLQGGDKEKNEKLVSIIQDYFLKYRKEHAPMHELCGHPTIEEVLQELEALNQRGQTIQISSSSAFNRSGQQNKNSKNNNSINNLNTLLKETQLLRKAMEAQNGRASNFSKYSQS